jgi:pyruvate formate lyase activating enzyme
MKGLIFNIEEFAVHDGPGIRKLVFFKGCPLHCSWCHNPEGISFRRELMVSYSACLKCGKCTEICTNETCVACEKCVEVCPLRLRKVCGQEVEAHELAEQLLKGKEILTGSGGGITVSGGEPLAQPFFLFELIGYLKQVHVAVETSGYAPGAFFQKMVSMTDLVLIDIKHTDPGVHKKFTGVDNRQILENLDFLCRSDTCFYVRIPLIPGVNDSRKNIEATAARIKGAKNLKRVELLPFHHTAGAKYPMVKQPFNPGFDTGKKVNVFKDTFENLDINVIVL